MNIIDIVLSFVAGLSFYVLPILFGRVLWYGYTKIKKTASFLPFSIITYFSLGALTFFAITVITSYFFSFFLPKISFELLFPILIGVLWIVSIIGNMLLPHSPLPIKKYILPISVCILLGSSIYLFWQWQSPFSFNWDLYEHQTLVNIMLDGRFSFVTSHISDTFGFNGYSSFFHTLLANSQALLPVSLPAYWHSISLIHFVIVIYASYLLAYEITRNRTISIVSAFLGASIFESTMVFTTFFFIPQTATGVFFIYLYVQLLKYKRLETLPPLFIVISSCLFLLFLHYVIGIFAIALYLSTYIYFRYHDFLHKKGYIRPIIICFLVLSLCFFFVLHSLPLLSLNRGEAASFTFSLGDNFTIMQKMYGFLLLLFLPIGIVTSIRNKDSFMRLNLICSVFALIVVLSQLPYVLKFYVVGRFFVHVCIAIGIYTVCSLITIPIFRRIAYGILGICVFIIFITNAATWKNFLVYHDLVTQVAPNEVKAAYFLKSHYTSDNMIVSDPATQHIFEAFSGLNTQGGAYANTHTRNILNSIAQTPRIDTTGALLGTISDTVVPTQGKRLLVLTGRYFAWQRSNPKDKLSINFNIWYPLDLTMENEKYIKNIQNTSKDLIMVYSNPTVVVFEAK